MTREIVTVAEGLQFPEGPVAMPDGSVILVEIAAESGARPNGLAVGPRRRALPRLAFQTGDRAHGRERNVAPDDSAPHPFYAYDMLLNADGSIAIRPHADQRGLPQSIRWTDKWRR